MVSIGVHVPRTRVTLASLLADRDASIAIKPSALRLAIARARRAVGTARVAGVRASVAAVLTLAVLLSRHGLVLAALTAWTVAAWWYAPIAGLVIGGAGAFFLELRRR